MNPRCFQRPDGYLRIALLVLALLLDSQIDIPVLSLAVGHRPGVCAHVRDEPAPRKVRVEYERWFRVATGETDLDRSGDLPGQFLRRAEVAA